MAKKPKSRNPIATQLRAGTNQGRAHADRRRLQRDRRTKIKPTDIELEHDSE